MSFDLVTWAIKHHVSMVALGELAAAFGHFPVLANGVSAGDAESLVQGKVRMAAEQSGFKVFRNNVGALKDERGVPVRYGLLNDTAALNKVVKSSDLIGWKSELWLNPETFQPTKIARFVSLECKHADWPGYNPENPHERAQQRWIELVVSAGGVGAFTTGGLPQ